MALRGFRCSSVMEASRTCELSGSLFYGVIKKGWVGWLTAQIFRPRSRGRLLYGSCLSVNQLGNKGRIKLNMREWVMELNVLFDLSASLKPSLECHLVQTNTKRQDGLNQCPRFIRGIGRERPHSYRRWCEGTRKIRSKLQTNKQTNVFEHSIHSNMDAVLTSASKPNKA